MRKGFLLASHGSRAGRSAADAAGSGQPSDGPAAADAAGSGQPTNAGPRASPPGGGAASTGRVVQLVPIPWAAWRRLGPEWQKVPSIPYWLDAAASLEAPLDEVRLSFCASIPDIKGCMVWHAHTYEQPQVPAAARAADGWREEFGDAAMRAMVLSLLERGYPTLHPQCLWYRGDAAATGPLFFGVRDAGRQIELP